MPVGPDCLQDRQHFSTIRSILILILLRVLARRFTLELCAWEHADQQHARPLAPLAYVAGTFEHTKTFNQSLWMLKRSVSR